MRITLGSKVRRTAFRAALVGGLLPAGACTVDRTLVMTPYVVASAGPEAFAAGVPEAWRTPEFQIIYVTDRARDETAPAGADESFTWRRGRSLRFGLATVALSPELTWEELVEQSTSEVRSGEFTMRIAKVEPVGVMKGLAAWIKVHDNQQVLLPEALEGITLEGMKFQELVASRLAVTDRKEAFVFVHGFNNKFDDGIFRVAELWHFIGRSGVPIAYSWPAARGGIRGYTYDRESGEFTIPHLKHFLRVLAATPGLERINLIAHSRGTDVAVTALRELYIEAKASGKDPKEVLRLGTLVLAAPDIDIEVFGQRFGAEMVVNAPERTVIYFSPDDDAIWWARWLFDSVGRLGDLVLTDLSTDQYAALSGLPRLELVDCDVSGFGTTHNYVFSHPAALSDLVRVLRDNAAAGSPERPLSTPLKGAWMLDNTYCCPERPSYE